MIPFYDELRGPRYDGGYDAFKKNTSTFALVVDGAPQQAAPDATSESLARR